MRTTDWFMGLDRQERKAILSVLHDHELRGVRAEWRELFFSLIRHLEDEHEEAKMRS